MEEIITKITESVFGSSYKNLEPVVGKGKNNQVFKIEVGGSLHILSLFNSEQQLDLYKKEKWCAEAARESGVKTPKISHVGFLNGWSYSFQEYVKGTHGTEAGEKEVWFKLGQVAKSIHQIPANEITLNYNQKVDELFGDNYFVDKYILSTPLSEAVKNRLSETFSWEFSPMLCHGNLHPSNVILNGDGQLWLFDWETATGNATPQADLAEIYTWNNGKDNIAKFYEGYGLIDTDVQNIMRDIQTLVLLRLVEVIQRMVMRDGGVVDPDNQYIRDTARRLGEITDYQADILFTKNL